MKILFFCCLALSVLVPYQTDWVKFESVESQFSILVPGYMELNSNEIHTEIGIIAFNTFQYKPSIDDRNALYIVHHYEYPEGVLTQDSSDLALEILEATVEESLITLNGSLDYKRIFDFNNYNGILYRIKYNNGKAVLKSKALIIGNQVYVLQVYATIDNSINDQMDYFLDSFQYNGS